MAACDLRLARRFAFQIDADSPSRGPCCRGTLPTVVACDLQVAAVKFLDHRCTRHAAMAACDLRLARRFDFQIDADLPSLLLSPRFPASPWRRSVSGNQPENRLCRGGLFGIVCAKQTARLGPPSPGPPPRARHTCEPAGARVKQKPAWRFPRDSGIFARANGLQMFTKSLKTTCSDI